MSPMYAFEDESGAPVEVFQPFEDSVPIGDWVKIDGVKLKRLVSMPLLTIQSDYKITGYTMSTEHPSIDAVGLKRDEDGHPLFSGIREIEKFNTDSMRQNERDPSVRAFGWD